jgi:hypothetical protein
LSRNRSARSTRHAHATKRFGLVLLAVAAVVALTVGSSAGAAARTASNHASPVPGGARDNVTPAQMPVGASNALVTYILQLSGDPVVVQDANSKDAGHGPLSNSQKQQATNQLKSQQAPVISAAQQLGAKFKSSFQAVFNGVSVTIPARNAWMLSTINGVTGVFRAHTFTPSNIHGVPLIGAP